MNKLKFGMLLGMLFGMSTLTSAYAQTQCQQTYQFSADTQTLFKFQQQNVSKIKITGLISTQKGETTDSGQWWSVQLTDSMMKGGGGQVGQSPEVEVPFQFHRSRSGLISQFRFPYDLESDIQERLKGMAYYFQYQTGVMTQLETDSIGVYQAAYQQTPEYLVKQKIKYTQLGSSAKGNGALNEMKVHDSHHQIKVSDCLLTSVEGRETMEAIGGGQGFSMDMQQVYQLKPSAKLADALIFKLPNQFADWQLQDPNQPEQLTDEQLAELRKQLQSRLSQLDIVSMEAKDLAKWLKDFDQAIDVIHDMFKQNTFDKAQSMRLFLSIGLLDSDNGNRLLSNIIVDGELGEEQRFRAMRALSAGTKPLSEAVTNQLVDMLNDNNFVGSTDIRGAAVMAIGAALAAREDGEHDEKLITEMTNRLSGDNSVSETSALIASLGNTQDPSLTNTVQSYADNDSAQVRSNAAFALGRFGTEEARTTLSQMLQSETEGQVQQAVMGAMSQFELNPQEIDKVGSIANASSSERTRSYAIAALSKQSHQPELVTKQLRQIMKTEKSKKNFKLAAQTLVKMKKQQSSD